MHDSPYDLLLDTAVQAARRAAAVIREQAGRPGGVRDKSRNDFVTDADERAQAVIVESLRETFPRDAILAEEGAAGDGEAPVVSGRRWIVDPIDGTTNFMHQVPPYAVSIALQEEDEIVVGVVLDVPRDELFTAVAGHGLQVNGEEEGVSATDAFGEAFLATGFPYRRFEHTDRYLDVLADILRDAQGVRRHGSAAVDLAWTACGRFDGFFETGLNPWDIAAGVLLVREGGGRVTNYHDDAGLTPVFDQQMCATNGPVHAALLGHLAPMDDVRL
ncbi:inositol monophosphatase family protein [Salinibacter ruber]|nr:inositol monophosphatase family protein [Salinibacter ruber]MCS3659557.1 myo-inositol-1(or 4)-monophosphatase [Salinibacter ruber]MCS4114508.1 myo-inositol-1(or 4)-monophosphatase [Salinibacter ruber]MCS4179829.1 myo-inositol-1(or 4)-monophosphatase [Salinibacter ruber]MCS4189301.1 myo-inositol-1(or 4)-monophosphatase [Salinibacter ruber]